MDGAKDIKYNGKENFKLHKMLARAIELFITSKSLGGEDMMENKIGFSYSGYGLMYKGYLINCHTLIL